MNTSHNLTPSAQNYLAEFYRILNRMIQGMTAARLTQSVSHNFIVQMLPHHRAAIEMSQNILSYTSYMPLRSVATQIISEQTKSIRDMLDIQGACSLVCNSKEDVSKYQAQVNRILRIMFRDMKQAPAGNDLSRDFICEMLPHHRGAVEMSQNALAFPICPSLRPILCAIITSQERGIRQMEKILQRLSS